MNDTSFENTIVQFAASRNKNKNIQKQQAKSSYAAKYRANRGLTSAPRVKPEPIRTSYRSDTTRVAVYDLRSPETTKTRSYTPPRVDEFLLAASEGKLRTSHLRSLADENNNQDSLSFHKKPTIKSLHVNHSVYSTNQPHRASFALDHFLAKTQSSRSKYDTGDHISRNHNVKSVYGSLSNRQNESHKINSHHDINTAYEMETDPAISSNKTLEENVDTMYLNTPSRVARLLQTIDRKLEKAEALKSNIDTLRHRRQELLHEQEGVTGLDFKQHLLNNSQDPYSIQNTNKDIDQSRSRKFSDDSVQCLDDDVTTPHITQSNLYTPLSTVSQISPVSGSLTFKSAGTMIQDQSALAQPMTPPAHSKQSSDLLQLANTSYSTSPSNNNTSTLHTTTTLIQPPVSYPYGNPDLQRVMNDLTELSVGLQLRSPALRVSMRHLHEYSNGSFTQKDSSRFGTGRYDEKQTTNDQQHFNKIHQTEELNSTEYTSNHDRITSSQPSSSLIAQTNSHIFDHEISKRRLSLSDHTTSNEPISPRSTYSSVMSLQSTYSNTPLQERARSFTRQGRASRIGNIALPPRPESFKDRNLSSQPAAVKSVLSRNSSGISSDFDAWTAIEHLQGTTNETEIRNHVACTNADTRYSPHMQESQCVEMMDTYESRNQKSQCVEMMTEKEDTYESRNQKSQCVEMMTEKEDTYEDSSRNNDSKQLDLPHELDGKTQPDSASFVGNRLPENDVQQDHKYRQNIVQGAECTLEKSPNVMETSLDKASSPKNDQEMMQDTTKALPNHHVSKLEHADKPLRQNDHSTCENSSNGAQQQVEPPKSPEFPLGSKDSTLDTDPLYSFLAGSR